MYFKFPCGSKKLTKNMYLYLKDQISAVGYISPMSVVNMTLVTKDIISNGNYDYDYGYDMWTNPFLGAITRN
jgi:hypothetical protein